QRVDDTRLRRAGADALHRRDDRVGRVVRLSRVRTGREVGERLERGRERREARAADRLLARTRQDHAGRRGGTGLRDVLRVVAAVVADDRALEAGCVQLLGEQREVAVVTRVHDDVGTRARDLGRETVVLLDVAGTGLALRGARRGLVLDDRQAVGR